MLVGGNRCDEEAVAYEKGADGIWAISGRIDGAEACDNNGVAVELNYDNALVRMAGNEVRAYRAAAGSWPQTASFQIPAVAGTTFTPMALQKSTAVSPGSAVFHRAGTAWSYTGQLATARLRQWHRQRGNGRIPRRRVARPPKAGTRCTSTRRSMPTLRMPTAPSTTRASSRHPGFTQDYRRQRQHRGGLARRFSAEPVVVGISRCLRPWRRPPRSPTTSMHATSAAFSRPPAASFALAGNVYNYLYRQSATAGESVAVLTDSDWTPLPVDRSRHHSHGFRWSGSLRRARGALRGSRQQLLRDLAKLRSSRAQAEDQWRLRDARREAHAAGAQREASSAPVDRAASSSRSRSMALSSSSPSDTQFTHGRPHF